MILSVSRSVDKKVSFMEKLLFLGFWFRLFGEFNIVWFIRSFCFVVVGLGFFFEFYRKGRFGVFITVYR